VILILDTHALLWSLEDSPRLSAASRAALESTDNVILASVASAWEIAIKKAAGRLDAPDDLEAAIEDAGFIKRVITFADVARLSALPSHHRDPFDRILVAQALVEGAPIVTCDPHIQRYQVQTLW
jgi:PIN domain nuclease of toxin-antitoxin system